MYLPKHFEETDAGVLHDLVRAHPLGALVTLTPHGLDANHIPFMLETEPAPFGMLRGHVARANPLWREFAPEVEALVIFQGPQTFISPSYYPTKKETAKVVPTWNYAVVHARGRLRLVEDTARLRDHLESLTSQHEAKRAAPWRVSDAPEDYVAMMMRAIVGLEITITGLVGKWKVSQNRGARDRDGVVEGLRREGTEAAVASANLVQRARVRAAPRDGP